MVLFEAFITLLLVTNTAKTEQMAVLVSGQIVLGGLIPIHEKGESSPCGDKIYNRGVQRLEAMLFAIDMINADPDLLPGIIIGVHILDTCSRETYALNQTLQFIRASLNAIDSSILECGDHSLPRFKFNFTGPVFGVIGGSYSTVSLQVANLLGLFHIPQISPASTAKALSDKSRFEYFARTVPPDTFQSIALVDIVTSMGWSYVSTVYSEGSYGEHGIEVFHKEAQERDVCIAVSEKVPRTADDKQFDNIINKLRKKSNAKAVILFTRAEDARGIMQAVKRLNASNEFYWVASDGWGKQKKIVEGVEDLAEGAITVELSSSNVPGFDEYMQSLTPENNKRNPWFEQYWEDTFGCVLPKNVPLVTDKPFNVCPPDLKLSEKVGYEQDSKVQFVVDAVYAFAYALNNLYRDVCLKKKRFGVCPEMKQYDTGDFYKKYLLNVSFIDLAGNPVQFDERGDGLARYDILNFQKTDNGLGYHYKLVGKWFNKLELNHSEIIWKNNVSDIPISACSLPCGPGMIKKQQGDTCCWICDKCEDFEYVFDEFTCKDCGNGSWPYPDKKSCYPLEIQYLNWSSPFALIPLAFSVLGIIATLSVICLFIKHNDTPLVRASGRELSYMLLVGILLCYMNTFVLLAKPTTGICIGQRFGIGVSFSIIYGALLTKTNRISRIFDSASRSAKRPKYISPRSQVCITSGLIAIQIILTLVWMALEYPGTKFYYPSRKQIILKCKIQDMSFLFSQLYNMLLITICTVYAVKTRKIPENFNESKFIGFTMYTTCVIWLAFVPIYFGTGNSYEIQITTLCIAISMNATVALVCLYSPKLYIILFHPDKNVRKLTMNTATYKRSHSTPGSSHTPSSAANKVWIISNLNQTYTATTAATEK
ncbi:metabotropic glutamate receptor isoform X2 [Agrilus planipennis]|uniref:Metabotropic glutamate receptor isoform X2 n=1 Tax=Agrilus planipennis TaxID=224129 RepID=A0A1W4WFD7_AGRPL|nr:metabotropic glutamate receptor isoform X2 [Agrilus planipennis]